MRILGIKPSFQDGYYGGHDAGACLLNDGEIIAIAEEERFTHEKHALETFPEESIRFVLEDADISLSDVDVLAIGRDPDLVGSAPPEGKTAPRVKNALKTVAREAIDFIREDEDPIEKVVSKLESMQVGDVPDQIETISHHRSHAASAAYCAPFDPEASITIDARGEYDSTVLWDQNLERTRTFEYYNSIGYFYTHGAQYLGYRYGWDAGKVMGLAPYGDYRPEFEEAFEELVDIGDGGYDVTRITRADDPVALLEEYFGERRNYPEEFDQYHRDFAYHLQQTTEEIASELIRSHCESTGASKVALAGGVAMNCKMNREILNLDCIDELFIQPAANDSGICLGAALEAHRRITGDRPDIEFSHTYWGPEFDDHDIEQALESKQVNYEYVDNISSRVADLLAEGNVVGWFQGRMEYGARALGNRSILSNPTKQEYMDRVNEEVKHRQRWRPFAPSLLFEARNEYLINGDEAPFMILLDSVRESKQDEVPAITHVDGTTRPQTVREEVNPRYYQLISEFEERTGVPVVLNTSFNETGDTIVESPERAVETYKNTGLDALAIGKYLLTKN